MSAPQSPETPARGSLDRMHAQIKSGDYLSAQTHALAAIAEALVQMVEPAPKLPLPVMVPTQFPPHDCEYDDPRMCAWPGHRS